MKNLKLLTAILCLSIFAFTSCQDEIDNENGVRENTNNASSPTASNLERTSMYDGSFDDFLDGLSCSSILFPVTATVNGIEITLINEADYELVTNILDLLNNDEDEVVLQFPFSVKLSNYTEAQVTNQTEYDALIDSCNLAENNGEDAISCIDYNFPFTILIYSLNSEQTGSVVIESEEQLYNYMNNFGSDELFAVNYPITATLNNDSTVTIGSDTDLQAQITDCLAVEDVIEETEENANILEAILVDGLFEVDSFITSGINTANLYADYTINFANDSTCVAENVVNILLPDVQGTYEVTSQTEVFLDLTFSGDATFQLLNNSWEVTSYSQSSISLQSTTNAAITLILTQI